MATARKDRRGFTLLEVLVALAIFALAAIVLGGAYLNVLNAYDIAARSNEHDEDLRFARAQLLAVTERQKAEEGDDFETAGGDRVRWRSTIESATAADLFRVTLTCEVQRTNQPSQTVNQTFMLVRPTWADPEENSRLRERARERILEIQQRPPRNP